MVGNCPCPYSASSLLSLPLSSTGFGGHASEMAASRCAFFLLRCHFFLGNPWEFAVNYSSSPWDWHFLGPLELLNNCFKNLLPITLIHASLRTFFTIKPIWGKKILAKVTFIIVLSTACPWVSYVAPSASNYNFQPKYFLLRQHSCLCFSESKMWILIHNQTRRKNGFFAYTQLKTKILASISNDMNFSQNSQFASMKISIRKVFLLSFCNRPFVL